MDGDEVALDFDYDDMEQFKLLIYSVLSGIVSLKSIEVLEENIEDEEDLKILNSIKAVIEFRESIKNDPVITPLDFGRSL